MNKFPKNTIKKGLAFIIFIQLVILAWEYLGAIYPIWTGAEISLKAYPVDPRDMFRGNYARLSYEISTIPMDAIKDKPVKIRNGEIIYVMLEKKGELYAFEGASFKTPASGIFLRGRIEDRYFSPGQKNCSVRYGIEAFFAKKNKAMALETDLRSGNGIAVMKVASNGKAALIGVHKNQP